MLREQTLGRVAHPDPLRVGDTGRVLHLIDDPLAARLQQGDPTLGWEGDERLALYMDPQARTWDLWRLEADGVYRPNIRLACDVFSSADVVPQMILRFMANDQRRGTDVVEKVMGERLAAEAEADKRWAELNGEYAERLHFALRKDGIDGW